MHPALNGVVMDYIKYIFRMGKRDGLMVCAPSSDLSGRGFEPC